MTVVYTVYNVMTPSWQNLRNSIVGCVCSMVLVIILLGVVNMFKYHARQQ